ncbi:MAG: hypothetical protein R6U61_00100 [Thermoplasmata archaeon]
MVDEQHLFRRLIHSMAWIFLLYYLVPEKLAGYSRPSLFLVVVLIILGFESLRLYMGWNVFGMRDYESKQIAAYAWATMAAAIALLLFPMHLAVICLFGMGIVDPIIGEIRYHELNIYPWVPLFVWFVISVIGYLLLTSMSLPILIAFSAVGAVVAVTAEKPTIIIDDDFLMVVAPLITLGIMELVLDAKIF